MEIRTETMDSAEENSVNTMCFTGHRQLHGQYYNGNVNTPGIWASVYASLLNVCTYAATERNVKRFITGGAIGIDTLAAQVVLNLRQTHPDVSLMVARPFPSQASKWPKQSQELAKLINEAADKVVDVSSDPYAPQKMELRNQWMIDNSQYVLAVKDPNTIKGGTANAIHYAKLTGKAVGILSTDSLTVEWFYKEDEANL